MRANFDYFIIYIKLKNGPQLKGAYLSPGERYPVATAIFGGTRPGRWKYGELSSWIGHSLPALHYGREETVKP